MLTITIRSVERLGGPWAGESRLSSTMGHRVIRHSREKPVNQGFQRAFKFYLRPFTPATGGWGPPPPKDQDREDN